MHRLQFEFGRTLGVWSVPFLCLTFSLTVGLSGCGTSSTVTELRAENERLKRELDEARMEAGALQRGRTVTVLSTDVYFESGSTDLTDEGVSELRTVAAEIRKEYPDRMIRIEGHTDSRPIGDRLAERFPSNWELSAARAARVARHFQRTHSFDPERFEVVGFGSHHPVATNETPEGRRKKSPRTGRRTGDHPQNRRLELVPHTHLNAPSGLSEMW